MKPPTIHTLLEDPAWRRMVKRVPLLAPPLRWGHPWAVYARRMDGRWTGGTFATYRDAWLVVVKAVRNPSYEDVSIVSRRQMFGPPEDFVWDWPFEWCSRCRRPSSFIVRPHHHALRSCIVLTSDDPYRCYYCGMRRVAMPAYDRH